MHIVQNHTAGTVSPSALSDGVHDGARCCNVGLLAVTYITTLCAGKNVSVSTHMHAGA